MNSSNVSCIQQFIYGSTPYSSGYSILAKTKGIKESLQSTLIQRCEHYDGQLYSPPPTPYSISVYSIESFHIFMEIFGNFHDQEGRPSRVMRNIVMTPNEWELIGGHPFILIWLLPSIHKSISHRRNEIQELESIDIANFSHERWKKLWWKETQWCLKRFSKLSEQDKQWLCTFQSMQAPFEPREIKTEKDMSLLCHLLSFFLSKEKRANMRCDSFSLNNKSLEGLSFRYTPYCTSPGSLESHSHFSISLPWLIESITYSIPNPYNFQILAWIWQHKIWKIYGVFGIGIVIFLLIWIFFMR